MAAYVGEDAIEMEPIETENIGSLANAMVSELPGCGDLMVRQALGNSLREFCRETDACMTSVRVPGFDYGPRGVLLAAPPGMIVLSVLDAKADGRRVGFEVSWSGSATFAHVDAPHGSDVEIRFSLAPKVGGEACPAWFKDRFAEAIVAGAMWHLMTMTGKAWSDAARASVYGARYAAAVAEAAYRRLNEETSFGGAANAIPQSGLFI